MPPAKSKRRWFQYSLRSLMLLMTAAAGAVVAWRAYLEPYHRQRQTMALIERLGGSYETTQAPAWLSRVLGYNVNNVVRVDLTEVKAPPAEYLEHVSRLPHLEKLSVADLPFGDDALRRLHQLKTLRELILSSTSVTDEAVERLQQALPELAIRRSQVRAIFALLPFTDEISSNFPLLLVPADLDEVDGDAIEITLRPGRENGAIPYLRALRTLRVLKLGGTNTDDVALTYVRGLTDLRVLQVPYTQVGDAGLIHLQRLVRLESLDLEGTRVGDAGLRNLTGLSSLNQLCLAGTNVSDEGLAALAERTSLERLDLRNTRVTADGVAKLKKSLPRCDVTF
jgi:hypothetical protein